jgi:hypothetical protein
LHETQDYGFFARDVPDMGYQLGGEVMASLLPVITHTHFTGSKLSKRKLLKVRLCLLFYTSYFPTNRDTKHGSKDA